VDLLKKSTFSKKIFKNLLTNPHKCDIIITERGKEIKPMKKVWLRQEIGTQTYRVEDIDHPMTDEELIDYCDPNNWGGRVRQYGAEAIVTVYTD